MKLVLPLGKIIKDYPVGNTLINHRDADYIYLMYVVTCMQHVRFQNNL